MERTCEDGWIYEVTMVLQLILDLLLYAAALKFSVTVIELRGAERKHCCNLTYMSRPGSTFAATVLTLRC